MFSENDAAPAVVDEEAPLLPKTKTKTPLPRLQLSIILFSQLCEPLASQSIYPYINQLVSELGITGGDERKVGYYAGMVSTYSACSPSAADQSRRSQESLFFVTEALTILQWSRASDHVGRKPILLFGLFGAGLSILCFGLSRTFWGLIVSRCMLGLLNGNTGVMKSAMGDLTDRSNRADAFVYLPIIWAAGCSLAPLIGGTLARPHDTFPALFSGQFWIDFPYFLPCLVSGIPLFISWFIVLAFFKETVKQRRHSDSESPERPAQTGPLSLKTLISLQPVRASISNYVTLGFLNTTMDALLPLFLAMPLEFGGLDLSPPQIGLILSTYGIAMGLFQFFLFGRFVDRFGEKRVFVHGISATLPAFALFPVISLAARVAGGTNALVWTLVGCLLLCAALVDTAYGAIFIFITSSAPASSRGSVNGIAQTSVAVARAIGPALATSLFSFSVQYNLLGGYLVYLVLCACACASIFLSRVLPEEVWEDTE
ncbi:unnamed protein product [Mycena citricolor]|uniref:Major facilitator superfamily (MFS) profile domain-containing protein n=1 Tax=Mycena citricolor TaxID=2018698 RepID=A0AAD2JYB6_9AGAR|nr:unnamed protein product [Mycena citricolor]